VRSSTVVFSIGFLLAAAPAFASKAKKAPAPAKEAPAEEAAADEAAAPKEETESQRAFKTIQWTKGPAKVGIDNHAEIQVPAGYAYTGGSGAQKLLELMHNPTSGTELGILTDEKLEMFLLFEFEDIGYVKDADKEKLDGDDILKSLRAGNEESNKARKQRGWSEIEITGWHTPPFYNPQTNNLEWCIQGASNGHTIVNYNTRILGRQGVMSANLMVDPEQLGATLPVAKKLLAGFTYVEGKKYSQFLPGDKVAKYGLTALVVGGAVGIAAKTGFLAKIALSLGKLWKLLIFGLIGIGVAIKKFLFGGHKSERPAAPPPAMGPPPQAP
jgi:uncharacterized membrane-anchored protein